MSLKDKRKDKRHKRHIKKRQKEYLRLERRTVRSQKRELRKLKNRYRFRSVRRFIIQLRRPFQFTDRKKKVVGSEEKMERPHRETRQNPLKSSRNAYRRPDGRLKSMWQERKKAAQERKKARANMKMLRRKIRSQRNQQRKHDVQNFLKNPFRWNRAKKSEKLLKRQIRQDLREQRKQRVLEFPSSIVNAVRSFFEKRKRRIRYRIRRIRDLFSPIARSDTTEWLFPDLVVSYLNSTAIFLIAFWIIFYLLQLASMLAAQRFSIPAVLYSFKVEWPLYTYSVIYTRRALVIIFGIGPLLVFLASFLFYRVHKIVAKKSGMAALLITWLLFQSVNQVFGGLIAGLLTRTGFARTMEWLFLTRPFDAVEISLLIASVFILIFAGFHGTRLFLRIGQNPRFLHPKVRPFYMLFQVVLPWITGTVLLYLSNVPNNPPELLILYAISFFMILPMLTNYNTPQLRSVRLTNPLYHHRVSWVAILSIVAGFVLIRALLFTGISMN